MTTFTAFCDQRRLSSGSPADVARAMIRALGEDADRTILTFDDTSGQQIDLDLRGPPVAAAGCIVPTESAAPFETATAGTADVRRPAGRPKLGVVAREVTLLPRHWAWLGEQPGGASVALRKLVETARLADGDKATVRRAQAAADRFMQAMLGDAPGYEDAARALYAGDAAAFQALSTKWPRDLRDYARTLAAPALLPSSRSARLSHFRQES